MSAVFLELFNRAVSAGWLLLALLILRPLNDSILCSLFCECPLLCPARFVCLQQRRFADSATLPLYYKAAHK